GTRVGLLTRQNLRARNLQELWSLRRGFLQAEQPQKALEIEELLRLWRRQNGVLKAVELAGALVMEGYENLDQRRFTRARRAFHLALEFDSGMSRAHLGLGRVAWESGEGLWAVAGHNRRALQALWRSRQRRSVLVRNALWAVATGIPVGVGLVCLLLLLKVGPLVHHRQAALLAARLPPTTSSVLALLIPWLPLALPAGSGWIPLF
ncbi:MAG: hypothetical protein ACE5ID_11425, partial [Acidobacteriota bacterium]